MCTKASDIQSYFYQHYVKQQDVALNSYGRNIHPERIKLNLFYSHLTNFILFEDDLRPSTKKTALTLHANKDPIGQFQTYHAILQSKITTLKSKINNLRESPALSMPEMPQIPNSGLWSFTNRFKTYRAQPALSQIVKNEPHSVKNMLEEKLERTIRVKNFNTRIQRDKIEHFVRYREDKNLGAGSKIKSAYASRSLLEIIFNERNPISLRKINGEKLVLITPVFGRLESFEKFLERFQLMLEKMNIKIELVVALFKTDPELERLITAIERVEKTQTDPHVVRFAVIDGAFSRGRGIAHAIQQVEGNPLCKHIHCFITKLDRYFYSTNVPS